jgi:uncharacterized protein (DUF302 family)
MMSASTRPKATALCDFDDCPNPPAMKSVKMTNDFVSGIVQFSSPWPFDETVRQVESAFIAKKIKVFDRIDQTAEAAAVGLALRPTTLFIFGDPSKGSH